MVKNLLATFLSRVFITLAGFLVVTLNAHFLGAEGVGTIGLIVLSISVIQLLNSIIGSGAMVYLSPRHNLSALIMIAYLWAIVSAIAGTLILLAIPGALPAGYATHIILLSILQALFTTNLSAIMGQERYREFNLYSLLQMLLLFAFTAGLYFYFRNPGIRHYLMAMYISGGITFIATFLALMKSLKRFAFAELGNILKSVAGFGSWIQIASVFQFFNYRLNYYFIENMLNRSALGVYAVGTQISESSWIVSRSIAMVQYSRISNEQDQAYARGLTLALVKLTLTITLLIIGLLLLLPAAVYSFVFTNEFSDVKLVILTMAIGIMSVSFSTIISHFFSGTGRPFHNTVASGIGFLATLIAGLILIPRFGLAGAGFTASLAYTASALYQFIVFLRDPGVRLQDMLLKREDLLLWKNEFMKVYKVKE